MMDGLRLFVEGWDLFSDAVWTAVMAGLLLGYLGVFVVLRRMVFFSAALSQAASLGVTLAFWLRAQVVLLGWLTPTLGAFLLASASALLLLLDRGVTPLRRDGILGLIWLGGAAGTLAMGNYILEDIHDVQTVLFGTAVAVLPEDARAVVWTSLVLVAWQLWWRRGFLQASFDPEGAKVRGLPVQLLDAVLFLSLALAIALCTRVLGALPVFAFTVLPALAALQLARSPTQALIGASILGATTGGCGYVVAFLLAWPVGATQTLFGVLLVLVATCLRLLFVPSAAAASR